jgi:hypothetical protein
MKQQILAPSTVVVRPSFARPHMHVNGSVATLTKGTDEYNDEDRVEKCIDSAARLICRD